MLANQPTREQTFLNPMKWLHQLHSQIDIDNRSVDTRTQFQPHAHHSGSARLERMCPSGHGGDLPRSALAKDTPPGQPVGTGVPHPAVSVGQQCSQRHGPVLDGGVFGWQNMSQTMGTGALKELPMRVLSGSSMPKSGAFGEAPQGAPGMMRVVDAEMTKVMNWLLYES